MKKNISFILNNKKVKVECHPLKTLLKVLREDLNHTEVKNGCEQGECGACTVIIDGEATNSCLVAVGQVEGKNVVTIKGLNKGTELAPIQKSFIDEGAVQCGFCTPGLIMVTKALLDKNPNPSDEEIKIAISGNLCRCTGYVKIFNAIKLAIKRLKKLKN
ncbi:MAG: (2Fe-2S)-binding protein [Endomicrobiia bacterium]